MDTIAVSSRLRWQAYQRRTCPASSSSGLLVLKGTPWRTASPPLWAEEYLLEASTARCFPLTRVPAASNGPARYAVYFGDQRGSVYAVDADAGQLLWKEHADPHPLAFITGAPQLWAGRVYVPVASGEENASIDPHYECCTFRGSVVAFDAESGTQVWKTYVIAEGPHRTQKSKVGTQLWGPSGVGIWSSPTIDPERQVLYVGTGNSYSEPMAPMGDALVAMDLNTGKIVWFRQMMSQDTWNSSCSAKSLGNCPDDEGPDFDFGSSPILVSLTGGHRALVAGQKSGMVSALDPDHGGKLLWQVRVGEGGTRGGVEFGSAADDEKVYVAVSDSARKLEETTINGEPLKRWIVEDRKSTRLNSSHCENRTNCGPAQSAAVSVIPGVVFSGSVDGHLRGYSAGDGHILWDFDTVRDYTTVNGVTAHGGSLDGPGSTIAGGMLYVNSGYGKAGMPGNVLLAFSVDGR